MGRLANRAKMTTTGGAGTLTLGSAVSGFQSFADAGIVDGDVVRYVIEDGSDWEIGLGTYTASGTTLSRTVLESSNADAAITASASAEVFITAVAEDIVGRQSIWVPAGAMTARTTSGAAAGSVETTNERVMLVTLDFDSAADEFAQFTVQMPAGWDGGVVNAQPVWSHPATATNFGVAWFVQAMSLADSDPADTAFGTAVEIDDTGGTTNDIFIAPISGDITIAGAPVGGELVVFQIYRDVSDTFDDMAVDARLHGVSIFYSTESNTDD